MVYLYYTWLLRRHRLTSWIGPIKVVWNQPKRVTPIFPYNMDTWLLRKHTSKKMIRSIKAVKNQIYWTSNSGTMNFILANA